MTDPVTAAAPRRRPTPATVALAIFLLVAFAGFVTLGLWQVQRMHWKHGLIERVDARVHAVPGAVPPAATWANITADAHEYRRVRLDGVFLGDVQTRTQAVTELGSGSWLLAPFRTDAGDIVLVNRGFVPTGADAAPAPTGSQSITGLLRLSEPDGGFLRSNDPARDRWYSRDVAAIAAAHGLSKERVAPFFVDAAHVPGSAGWPRGGMTVIAFRDSHLSYALTWFGMALLTVFASWRLVVSGRRPSPVAAAAGTTSRDTRRDAMIPGHARSIRPIR